MRKTNRLSMGADYEKVQEKASEKSRMIPEQ